MEYPRVETPMERGRKMLADSGYRAEGGKVTVPRVKRIVRRAIEGHEDAEHGGERKPLRLKAGGAVKGRKPAHRPDRKARDAGGAMPVPGSMSPQQMQEMQMLRSQQQPQGAPQAAQMPPPSVAKDGGKVPKRAHGGGIDNKMNGVVHVDRRYEAEGIDQPHGPERRRATGGGVEIGEPVKVLEGGGQYRSGRPEMPPEDYQRVPHRAAGGMMPEAPKVGGMGKRKGGGPKTVNVIVGKGDDGQQAQQAHQAGMQQGVQLGARMAAQKMAGGPSPGAGPGGPPRPPMAPPPGAGMPPPGAMAGAPRPPMTPGGMPPQMARRGGTIKVRAHERRAGGSV